MVFGSRGLPVKARVGLRKTVTLSEKVAMDLRRKSLQVVVRPVAKDNKNKLLFYSAPLSKIEITVTNIRWREPLCKCKLLNLRFTEKTMFYGSAMRKLNS